jgi:hypothetical protein
MSTYALDAYTHTRASSLHALHDTTVACTRSFHCLMCTVKIFPSATAAANRYNQRAHTSVCQ